MPYPSSDEIKRLEQFSGEFAVQDPEDTPSLWGETMRAGFDQIMAEERSDSKSRAWRPHLKSRATAIKNLGGDSELAFLYAREGVEQIAATAALLDTRGEAAARSSSAGSRRVDALLQQRLFERAFPDEVSTDAQLATTITQELAQRRNQNQSVMARGPASAAFVGQAGALVTDPAVLVTLPLGGPAQVGRGLMMNAARGFGIESSIAVATEIPIQFEVLQFKDEIDSPWTYADAAFNVLSATLGAGILRATGSITIDMAGNALKKYGRLSPALKTDESEAAAAILESLMDTAPQSPREAASPDLVPEQLAGEAPLVDTAHTEALSKARAQSEAGEAVDVTGTLGLEPLNEVDQSAQGFVLENVTVFGPEDIQVDAARFQFKGAGDASGVTTSLAKVDKFDQSLAGQVLLWEDAAGTQFIVDGHQRLALAKRAVAAGQDPAEVRLSGFILREADGIADIDAMRIGAVRNLTASTGDALDAAKVLRGIGPAGELLLPPLPPSSALLRQGRFLARLGDEAFNAVVNDVVPPRFGAVVGELIGGNAEQVATINALARLAPPNELQARAMVEQIKTAGFAKRKTADLFGEREVAESLIKERAQVLDSALKSAKADKQTFGRLVSRETTIEEAGHNKLDSRANQAKVDESGQAIEIISRLANTKGEVSDALTAAAKKVSQGAKPADVTDPVLEAVRRATKVSDPGRRAADAARPVESPVPGRAVDRDQVLPEQEAAFLEALTAGQRGKNTPEKIIAGAPEAQKAYVAELQTLLDDIAGASLKVAPQGAGNKTLASVKKKLDKRPAAGGDPSTFTDILRATLVIDSPDISDAVIARLVERWGVSVEDWAVRGGYYDRAVNIVMDDGRVAELLFLEPAMFNAKFKGHDFYDIVQDVSRSAEERDAAELAMNELYGKAQQDAGPEWDQVLGPSEGRGAALGATRASSSSEISLPSKRTIPGAAATQEPVPSKAQAAEPSADTTAALPSSRKALTESTSGDIIPPNGGGPQGIQERDLLGDDTRTAQALADETARRDAARTAGQESVETGDPGDMFSQATRQQDILDTPEAPARGRPDEGSATGYVSDAEYDAAIARLDDLETEAGELVQVSRVTVDESGNQVLELVSARRAMNDLNDTEAALLDVQVCTKGTG